MEVKAQQVSPNQSTPTPDKDSKSLLEKLAGFQEFPQFWDEDNVTEYIDPDAKAEEDRIVEEFKNRLEEASKIASHLNERKVMEKQSLIRLKDFCRHTTQYRCELSTSSKQKGYS
eukprot:TRINITY_DN14729_c0_g1_i1.p1 TRINITY_DN14729_c0_g1~~TRINITY_DN14729_c0_g1_i1.p1  ORF type:complete len:115 (-),score=33.06 TRINITY_DN14729_c0_g1_i1:147-491(-)